MPSGKRSRRVDQPGETPRNAAPSRREVKWGGYVDVRVDDAMKERFYAWFEGEREHIWEYVEDALGEGYKLGITFDREHSSFIATFTRELVLESDAWRYVMTARAGTWFEAIALLAFKDVVICQRDWDTWRPSRREWETWG